MGSQIDQQVAARHHVHPGEGRIAQGVVRGEGHHIAQAAIDLHLTVALVKIALATLLADVLQRTRRIHAAARHRQSPLVEIGSVDLNPTVPLGWEQLMEQDRQRVGFFARAAADHPCAHPCGVAIGQHHRQHLGQLFPDPEVAKEPGHPYEHIAVQRIELVRMIRQVGCIRLDALNADEPHASAGAAIQGPQLVVREVDARQLTQLRNDVPDPPRRFILRVPRRPLFPRRAPPTDGEVDQRRRNVRGREHQVHHVRGDGRFGHASRGGRGRILGHGQATGFSDPFEPQGAIVSRAGEHDTGRPRALGFSQRGEQVIHQPAANLLLRKRLDLDHAFGDVDLRVRCDDVCVFGLDPGRARDLRNREIRGAALQDLGYVTGAGRVQMQDEHEGDPGVRGYRIEKGPPRLDTTRRGTHGYDKFRLASG